MGSGSREKKKQKNRGNQSNRWYYKGREQMEEERKPAADGSRASMEDASSVTELTTEEREQIEGERESTELRMSMKEAGGGKGAVKRGWIN